MEKVCQRRSAGEGLTKKFYKRRSTEEGSSEKVRRRRSAGEDPLDMRDVAGKVAGKVTLIPCEEKNNSLIFID